MEILIIAGLVIIALSLIISLNSHKKEIERLRMLNKSKDIPYADYARYQKAYVEFSKWIDKATKEAYYHSIFEVCQEKFNELFNDKTK